MSKRTIQLVDPVAGVFAKVDQTSQHLVAMNEIHARIHEGILFSVGLADAAVANDGSLEILIQTPAAGALHLRASGSVGGDSRAQLFEGTDAIAGAALTPVNRNRFSTNVSGGTFSSAPTITTDGTPLFDGYINGGGGGQAVGGQLATFAEYIFAQNTKYLARITNISGQTRIMNLTLDFYDTGAAPSP